MSRSRDDTKIEKRKEKNVNPIADSLRAELH